MALFPLLRPREPDAVVAYRDERALTVKQFLGDVQALAEQMPERRNVLNLCLDRYRFAVALAAAVHRQQISLLPPNHTAALLQKLQQGYLDLYVLTDSPNISSPIETVLFPDLQKMTTRADARGR